MIFRSLLSSVPFVLHSLMSPDAGAPAGGGGAPATAPEPVGATLEEKLGSAKSIIQDFFKQLSGAFKERDEAVSALEPLKLELKGASEARDKFKKERDEFETQLGTMTTLRDGEKSGREKAENRVTLVESFAKGHGLDLSGIEKKAAAPAVEGDGADEGKKLYDQWQALKAKDGKKATAFFRKHKSALKDYADSLE